MHRIAYALALAAGLFGLLHVAQAAPANRESQETALALATTTQLAPLNSTAIDTLTETDETGVRVKRSGCGCCGCGGCGCCCCRPCCCCCKPCCCCRCCRCCTCCTCCRCCRCCCCKPCCCGCCGCGGCGCCGCGGGRKRRALQALKIKLADKLEKEAREGLPMITGPVEMDSAETVDSKPANKEIELPEPIYNLGGETTGEATTAPQ